MTAPCRVDHVEPPEIEPDPVLPLASSVLLLVEDHDLEDETLVLTVQDEAETVLDERRALLEEMVRSLRVSKDP